MQIQVTSKKINSVVSLSQSINLGLSKPFELNDIETRQSMTFVTEYRAENATNRYHTVFPVSFEPVHETRLLLDEHLAGYYVPLSFNDLELVVRESFMNLIRTPDAWVTVYTYMVGKGERPPKMAEVNKKDPNQIAEHVVSRLKVVDNAMSKLKDISDDVSDRLRNRVTLMIAAYINSRLALLNWLTPGTPIDTVYPTIPETPQYSDFVDIVSANDLRRFLVKFDRVTMQPIKNIYGTVAAKEEGKQRRLNPQLLALETVTEAASLTPTVRRTSNSRAIVESFFYMLRRSFYPELHLPLDLSAKHLESAAFSAASTNITMFLIHTENVRDQVDDYDLHFTTNIADDVLGAFTEAMADLSPYKSRPLESSTKNLSKTSLINHHSEPTLTHVFEEIDFNLRGGAFSVSTLNNWAIMDEVTGVHEKFTNVMDSVKTYTNPTILRSLEREMHINIELQKRMGQDGTAINFEFPSVYSYAASRGIDLAMASKFAHPESTIATRNSIVIQVALDRAKYWSGIDRFKKASGELISMLKDKKIVPNQAKKLIEENSLESNPIYVITARELNDVRRSLYHRMIALACRLASNVSLIHHEAYDKMDAEGAIVGLSFDIRTELVQPLSDSAIVSGLVRTTEPLEVLLYARDFQATESVVHYTRQLPDSVVKVGGRFHRQDWDWKTDSRSILYTGLHKRKVNDQEYKVQFDERRLLSLPATDNSIRRMHDPLFASSIFSVLEGIASRVDALEKAAKEAEKKGDTDLALAHRGVIVSMLRKTSSLFSALAATSMGETLRKHIKTTVQNQMRGKGLYSDMRKLNSVISEIRLDAEIAIKLMGYVFDKATKDALVTLMNRFTTYNVWEVMISDMTNGRTAEDNT